MKTTRKAFIGRYAPILDPTKHRRNIVKSALTDFITKSEATPRNRAAARSLLGEINRLERERPDTTVASIMAMGGNEVCVWVYEKELAPIGSTPKVTLPFNAAMRHAVKAIEAVVTA